MKYFLSLIYFVLFSSAVFGQNSSSTQICTDTLILKNEPIPGQPSISHKPLFSLSSTYNQNSYIWSIGIGYPGSWENYLKISPTFNLDNYVAAFNTSGFAIRNSKSIQLNTESYIVSNPLGEAYNFGFNISKQATQISSGNRLRFLTAGNLVISADINGKVGIGIENPSATLDVNGSLRINGGSVYQKVQSGEYVVGTSNQKMKTITFTFPTAFNSIPSIICTPKSTNSNVDEVYCVTIKSISVNSVTINVLRLDDDNGWTQPVILFWQAWN